MAWRNLLPGRRQMQRAHEVATVQADSTDVAQAPNIGTLGEIEAAALSVYADHGLPIQRGHYRRGPRARRWEYLGDNLDAARRWDMVLERPSESGWRFAILEDLGRYAVKPELVAASALLATCRRLRDRRAGKVPGDADDDIECAIQLGVAWQKLQDSRPWRDAARLRLTVPDEVGGPSATGDTKSLGRAKKRSGSGRSRTSQV